jgi:DNA-binding CsgD family transcriptional regulator
MEDPKIHFRKKPLKISSEMAKQYSHKKIKENLDLFNQINDSRGYFFIVDHLENKLILGNSDIHTIVGYSSAYIESKSRFEFHTEILKPDELDWFYTMSRCAQAIFLKYPEEHRLHMEISYDLIVTVANGTELIFRHKMVPYQFDKNGNLWMGLGHVSALSSRSPMAAKAIMTNFKTGDLYKYLDGEFVLVDKNVLTPEDVSILRWMAEDLTAVQIGDKLRISESSFKRRRKKLFQKLNVHTAAGAVYKASLTGII